MKRVAIVTGASRGLGRGIALTLAKEEGYTVYATARSKADLEKVAEEASANITGGVVYPYQLDQNEDTAVEAFVAEVAAKEPNIKLLVNNSYGGLIAIAPHFGKPFWERPLSVYDDAMNIGVRSAYVMSKFVVPLMQKQNSGLIIQTSSTGAFHYAFDVAYGIAHAAIDRLTTDMALELRPHNIRSVTLHPVGGCQTELLAFPGGESVVFVGRAAAALAEKATDADFDKMNGKVVITAELADKYGFSHDNDPHDEIKLTKIEEAKLQRAMMSKPQIQNEQIRTLEAYDSDHHLPFKLSETNSAPIGEFFSEAKKLAQK